MLSGKTSLFREPFYRFVFLTKYFRNKKKLLKLRRRITPREKHEKIKIIIEYFNEIIVKWQNFKLVNRYEFETLWLKYV